MGLDKLDNSDDTGNLDTTKLLSTWRKGLKERQERATALEEKIDAYKGGHDINVFTDASSYARPGERLANVHAAWFVKGKFTHVWCNGCIYNAIIKEGGDVLVLNIWNAPLSL